MCIYLIPLILAFLLPIESGIETAQQSESGLEAAQIEQVEAAASLNQSASHLFERLAALPDRWQVLADPLLADSGHSLEEIIRPSSPDQRELAESFINWLMTQPKDQWQAAIRLRVEKLPLTEIDLWLPIALIPIESRQDPEYAMRLATACLQW
ncbi:MAG: hypothetical protein V3T83_17065, partial [Acidobacteriota bacterium]